MEIGTHRSFTKTNLIPSESRASAMAQGMETSEPAAWPTDSVDIMGNLPSVWQDIDSAPVSHPSSPPPALERPVIFIHGFNGKAERWDNLIDWLSSGENPANKDGGIVDAGQFHDLDPKANLFSLRLSRPYNSIEKNTSELKAAVEAVTKATGAAEVDVVAHSLGGLNTRNYLRDPQEKVNRLVMLGTPNKGSQLANLERLFRENFNYPISPPVDDPEVRRVLEQLSVDRTDRRGRPQNPFLNDLNRDWDNHRKNAEVLIVAGSGIPTLGGFLGATPFGDGVVTRSSARMPGVENRTSWFRTHGGLQNSTAVMETTANFLAGKPLPPGEDLFDSPEDRLKAEKLKSRTPPPPPTAEKVDLERVQDAVRHPILDPAFQFGLGLSVLASMMGGPKETLPLIEIDLNSRQGGGSIQAHYNIDLGRQSEQVRGHGRIDGTPFKESARLVEGDLEWKTTQGRSRTNLVIAPSDDDQGMLVRGNLQGVATDLRVRTLADDNGMLTGLETTGAVNGEPFYVKSTVDLSKLLSGPSEHHNAMHVTGMVDGTIIEKQYTVGVQRNAQGLEFTASGAGINAGLDQQVGMRVQVRDR